MRSRTKLGLFCFSPIASNPLRVLLRLERHPRNMASDDSANSRIELYDSALTVPSDSENYSANQELSSSQPSSSSSPLILYHPPTLWSVLRGAAINIILPFVNGLMLGLGELLAHEAAFRLGWSGTKVCLVLFPCRSRCSRHRDYHLASLLP